MSEYYSASELLSLVDASNYTNALKAALSGHIAVSYELLCGLPDAASCLFSRDISSCKLGTRVMVTSLDALNHGTMIRTTSPCLASLSAVEANFPLFIIYTSGTTGKPKGIVHAHGYLAGIMMTMQTSFDTTPGADIALVLASFGWITGQSYMIAGTLASRVPTIFTQANPVSPYIARFAAIIQEYNVTILKGGVAFLKFVMAQ